MIVFEITRHLRAGFLRRTGAKLHERQKELDKPNKPFWRPTWSHRRGYESSLRRIAWFKLFVQSLFSPYIALLNIQYKTWHADAHVSRRTAASPPSSFYLRTLVSVVLAGLWMAFFFNEGLQKGFQVNITLQKKCWPLGTQKLLMTFAASSFF